MARNPIGNHIYPTLISLIMDNLDAIAEQIEKEMDEKDAVRELAIKSSRAVIRMAGNAIRGMHRKENVETILGEMRDELSRMLSILKGHPDLAHTGFVENAFIEFSEASIVLSVVTKKSLPTPKELGVTNSGYLQGMGDAVGEFRRFALNSLRDGKIKDAFEYLKIMDDIHNMLMRFDYPDALLSIRRQQDLSRSLVEKTSGEITLTARTKELEIKLNELKEKIEISNRKSGKTKAKPKRKK